MQSLIVILYLFVLNSRDVVSEWRDVQYGSRRRTYKKMWVWIVRYRLQYSNYPLPESDCLLRRIYIKGKHAQKLVDEFDQRQGAPAHCDTELLDPQKPPPEPEQPREKNVQSARRPTKKPSKRSKK